MYLSLRSADYFQISFHTESFVGLYFKSEYILTYIVHKLRDPVNCIRRNFILDSQRCLCSKLKVVFHIKTLKKTPPRATVNELYSNTFNVICKYLLKRKFPSLFKWRTLVDLILFWYRYLLKAENRQRLFICPNSKLECWWMTHELRPRDNAEQNNKKIDSQRLFDILSLPSSWLFPIWDFV